MSHSCEQCGRSFSPCPSVPHQRFCGKSCAKEHKRQMQKSRLANDPDYRENQKSAQKAWRQSNPKYMREYRKKHPEYVRRNRNQQRHRNKLLRKPTPSTSQTETSLEIVKMTELQPYPIYVPGPYQARLQNGEVIVKMTEFIPHPVWVSGILPIRSECEP